MGGPCYLVDCKGKTRKDRRPKRQAPACTDNFQIKPFMFNGTEWFSVEQCFQAMKFTKSSMQERLRLTKPRAKEDDENYSLRLWDMGQRKSAIRPDWDSIKVAMMYRIVAAKYAQHADLQADLVSTGDAEIVGGMSTSWVTNSGRTENWGTWNGIIQMRVREELRLESERKPGLLESLVGMFQEAGFGAIGKHVQEQDACSDVCRLCHDRGTVDGLEGTCPLCDGLGLSGM